MTFKDGKNDKQAPKSETGLTPLPDFSPTPSINYTVKPTPNTVLAKFEGISARCGKCRSKLGEFVRVEGTIQCKKNDCKCFNIVKR